MKLFNRSTNAEGKWHKKAIFVNLSKTRIVFVDTTETKPECEPSRIPKIEIPKIEIPKIEIPKIEIPKIEPQSVIEELLNQEQFGLLWFLDRSISNRQTDGNVKDWGLTSVQVARTERRKNLNCDLLLPQSRLPFPMISGSIDRYLL